MFPTRRVVYAGENCIDSRILTFVKQENALKGRDEDMATTYFAQGLGVRIVYEQAGTGFPLLLLHGFPQSRRMWRHVIPALARRFTVIAADLRGYGDSEPSDDPSSYDKHTMSEDMLALMTEVGFAGRFLVAGHDRGGRVTRRMAADHAERLVGASLLDIMPMEWVFSQGEKGYANRYWHWYFHLQRELAEEMIGAKPEAYAQYQLARAHVKIDPVDVEHYSTLFSRPRTIAASLADYRTAFEIDRPRWEEEVTAGKRIQVPLQLLWGDKGNLRDAPVLEEWQKRAISVRGHAVRESGHFIPEEQPEQVIQAINEFADELKLP
jgi:haloacetate dehalogenase